MRPEYTASRLIPYPVVLDSILKKPGFLDKPGFFFDLYLSSGFYPRSP